jgi:hypothetical protein
MGGACGTYGEEKCTNFGWYIPLRNILIKMKKSKHLHIWLVIIILYYMFRPLLTIFM